MDWKDVINNWQVFAEAIQKLGGDVQAFTVAESATENEILALEKTLGFRLPASLREVLLTFSKKVVFRWFFPPDFELEGDLFEIFSGDRHWSLDWIAQFNEDKNQWVNEVFSNKDDPYDSIWHNKLAFHEVGNGDYLAIDLSQSGREPVVYLSHDDGKGHGIELASNFKEFVISTSQLGCVGGEDWQWLPFVEVDKPYLNPACDNAEKFRRALGIQV